MISDFFSMIFEGSGSVFGVSVRSIFNQFCQVFTKFGILLATSSVFSSAIISSTSSFIIGIQFFRAAESKFADEI